MVQEEAKCSFYKLVEEVKGSYMESLVMMQPYGSFYLLLGTEYYNVPFLP